MSACPTSTVCGLYSLAGFDECTGNEALGESLMDLLWLFWLAAAVGITVSAYFFARTLWSLLGMPITARVEWNFGVEGLKLQAANYNVFHQTTFNHVTHITIPYDIMCWFMIVRHFLGLEALVLLVAVLCYQTLSFKEKPSFTIGMIGLWLAILGSTLEIYGVCGPTVVRYAWVTIPFNALFRVVGHATEPVPPLVNEKPHWTPQFEYFSRAKFSRMFLLWIFGMLAELVAALPYRVFVPQMFFASQYFLAYEPLHGPTLAMANHLTYEFYKKKWSVDTADDIVKETLLDPQSGKHW